MALGSRGRLGHARMSQELPRVVFDASGVVFCAGPCRSKEPEGSPIEVAGAKRFHFKPFSGGRYKECCYPVDASTTLVVTNLRVCHSCNKRYLESWDEQDYETLAQDARTLCVKLGIDAGVSMLGSVPAASAEHQPERAALD